MPIAPSAPPAAPRSRRGLLVGAALAGAALGAAAFYGPGRGLGNAEAQACAGAKPVLEALRPLARGGVAGVQVLDAARPMPDLVFNGPDGAPTRLSAYRGRAVLVNLWATWCAPCRAEMPALDALQAALGGGSFEVTAINLDQRNPDRPRAWLAEAGVTHLAYLADPSMKVLQDLRAVGRAPGLPTTLLVDARGCEVAHLPGPADWGGPDALALARALAASAKGS